MMDELYEVAADFENNDEVKVHYTTCIDSKYNFIPHYHNSIELIYVISGNGSVRVDSEEYNVKKGDITVFNTKQVHIISTDSTLCYGCFIISRAFLKKYNFPYKEVYIKNLIHDEELNHFICSLRDEAMTESPYHAYKMHSLLMLITIKLFSDFEDKSRKRIKLSSTGKSSLVIDAIDYIGDNYTKSISIDEIAKKIGYSKYYLCRTFKDVTNQTIIEYVNSIKCAKAAEDLKSGEFTVSEVANKYNFENFSYFSEVFRKYTGHSPSFFKKK